MPLIPTTKTAPKNNLADLTVLVYGQPKIGKTTFCSQAEGEDVGGANTPLKRSARPDEIGRLICFLASDEASYITGHVLNVNGGMLMG